MSLFQWNLVDTGASSGLSNMRFDEELAQAVASGFRPPTLRFFQWDPYCISLGKHQSLADVDVEGCQKSGMDVVYRPTGGRAILHAEELTYSFVFRDEISGSVEETYRQISTALVLGLRTVGIPAEMSDERRDWKKWYQHPSSASCFASSARYEIQVMGKKIIGSAQKRYSGATLQHGSILIGPYHRRLPEFLNLSTVQKESLRRLMDEKTIELDSIRPVDVVALKESLVRAFAQVFQVQFFREESRDHVPVT